MRDAAIDLLESCGFSVSLQARRALHRRLLVFVGDASFATRGAWAKGHAAAPVKQVHNSVLRKKTQSPKPRARDEADC